MLADRIKNRTGFYEQQRALVELKTKDKHLRAVHSQVLQDVVLRLDKAYQAFFVGLSRSPRFKRSGRYKSFTYPQSGFKLEGEKIRLSAIGSVRLRLHREVTGAIKRVTIVREIDQWFVILFVQAAPTGVKPGDGAIGVDLGITNLVALSNGTRIANPGFLNRSKRRIEALKKEVSAKNNGSRNREKARIALAKAWRKVKRQREDFAHKLSDRLTKDNKFIVFEDLKIRNMVKNRNLASAIMDSGWGKLCQLTAYKAEARGGRIIFVEPKGTSQKCSGCGDVVPKELSERVHDCPRCGLVMDRDVNAARNILKLGQELTRVEERPLLIQRRRVSKFALVKQEVHGYEVHGLQPWVVHRR